MSLETSQIDQGLIDIARMAPADLLEPAAEPAALSWVAEQIGSTTSDHDLTVWKLSDQEMEHFAADLALPTPERYPSAEDHQLTRYGILQLAIASTLGTPYGIEGQRNGVSLHDVFPREELFDRKNSSMGAHQKFEFHTDQAFSTNPDERPDSVLLGCVRNIEEVATRVVELPKVIEQLNEAAIAELLQPNYIFFRGRPEEAAGEDLGAVLIEVDGSYKVRVGGDTKAQTFDGQMALASLRSIADTQAEPITLRPGEILTFPNWTILHDRESFEPAKNPAQRRWLQKAYIANR